MTVIGKIFEAASIEQAGYDPALSVLRLSRRFFPIRVEAVCELALRGRPFFPLRAHAADPRHRARQNGARPR